jgi:hypothetical protein
LRPRLRRNALLFTAIAAVSLASVVPAFAQDDTRAPQQTPTVAAGKTAKSEASIAAFAWYWRDQQQQKVTNPVDGTDVATLELKNPYCPETAPVGSPPEQVCKTGRLPVEVRLGDYARPHKISAVNFDLSVVPPGSKIKKFTAKFYEATDEQSRSTQANVDGKRLVACEIDGIFGDGEARLYKERPEYECNKNDESTLRNSETVGKGDNEQERFYWEFDLTKQAKEWMKKEEFFTSIMLHPKEPRDPTPQDQAWQVVLAGPMEEKFGVETEIVYISSGLPTTAPPPPPIDEEDPIIDEGGTDTTTDFDDTSTDFSGSDIGSSSTSVDSGTSPSGGAPTEGAETGAAPDPTEAGGGDPELASDEQIPSGMPMYMWLALLAGLLGYSLVRQVVIEKNTGVRPNGVLAQIQKLNAQRRGGEVAAGAEAAAGPFAAISAGLGSLGSKIGSGAGKIGQMFSRKKG